MRTRYVLAGIAIVVFSVVAGIMIADGLQTRSAPSAQAQTTQAGAATSSAPASQLSETTLTYLATAIPALAVTMDQWQAGEYGKATKRWKSIGDIPTENAADNVMADAYLAYANNVRYYMIGDGSATLKDVETARDEAMATLDGFVLK
jgi:hypothetical protein